MVWTPPGHLASYFSSSFNRALGHSSLVLSLQMMAYITIAIYLIEDSEVAGHTH